MTVESSDFIVVSRADAVAETLPGMLCVVQPTKAKTSKLLNRLAGRSFTQNPPFVKKLTFTLIVYRNLTAGTTTILLQLAGFIDKWKQKL